MERLKSRKETYANITLKGDRLLKWATYLLRLLRDLQISSQSWTG